MALVLDRFAMELGIDASQFVKGQRDAVNSFRKTREAVVKDGQGIETAAEKAASSVERLVRNFAKLFAIVTTGRSLSGFVSDVTQADAALGRLATSIGRAPELISAMSRAVERSGGDAQAAARSFQSWSEQVEQIRTTGDSSILPFLARLQAAGGKTIDLNKKNVDGLADLADNLKAVAEQQGIASATYYGKNLGFDEGTIALMVKGGAALRAAIRESEKLGIATRKDTGAAQALQTAYRTLTQEIESFGRTILTAVSPVLVQLLKDIQAVVRAIREWVQTNVVPFLKEFADSMGIAGSETKTLVRITEALFALWLGSKAIAFLRVLGTMRLLLTGGRVAAGGALAGSSGLLGAIIGGLAVGGTIGADRSTPNAEKPGLQRHWDDEASGAAPGGMWGALKRGWSWSKRKLFGDGGASAAPGAAPGAAAGGGSLQAVPESVPMTAAERNTLGLIMKHESGGKNTMNYVGKSQGLDPATPQGYTAQGYYQMLNSNWRRIAPLYGIKTPNAMASSMEDQTKVALHLLRNGGVQNWTNYNPALRAAIARGDTAPASGPLVTPTEPITGAKEVAGGVHPLGGGGRPKDGFGMRRHPIHGDVRMHAGVDLAAPAGTNVQAMASGAISVGRSGDVTVKHADGTSTTYRHVVPSVKEGDRVAAGQVIAQLRAHDPRSTGPHLHFEARDAKGGLIDPKTLLAPKPQAPSKATSEAGAISGRTAQWWRGSPNAMASVTQARDAQSAQAARISNDNRSSSSVRNSTRIGSVTVQTAATDANGIARDMEDALKRRSFVAAATTGQA